ncbi:unnamed protein product, partial [Prorocentrum cordatum]
IAKPPKLLKAPQRPLVTPLPTNKPRRSAQQDCPPSRHAPPRAAAQRTPLAKGVAPARGPAACPIGLGARPRVGQRGHGRCGGGGATENQREGGEGRGLCCSQRA